MTANRLAMVAVIALGVAAPPIVRAQSATMVWTNGSDVWQSYTAWTTNVVGGTGGYPGQGSSTDAAIFTNAATYQVTLTNNVMIQSNYFGNASNTAAIVTLNLGTSSFTSVFSNGADSGFVVGDKAGSTTTVYLASSTQVQGGLVTSGQVIIGRSGLGILYVTNGYFQAGSDPGTKLGSSSGGRGTLVVSGSNAIWNNTRQLSIGSLNTFGNLMVVSNSASLTVGSTFRVGSTSTGGSSNNTLLLDSSAKASFNTGGGVVGKNGGSVGAYNNTMIVQGGAVCDFGAHSFNIGSALNFGDTGPATGNVLTVKSASFVTNISTLGITSTNTLDMQGGVLGTSTTTNYGVIQGFGTISGRMINPGVLSPGGGTLSLDTTTNIFQSGTISVPAGGILNVLGPGKIQNDGQISLLGGTLLASNVVLGSSAGAQGTLTVASGTNMLWSTLDVGSVAGATGTVWITGGQFAMPVNGVIYVGNNGAGEMTVSNGNLSVFALSMAVGTNSVGTLTVSGGSVILSNQLSIGFAFATGTVWVTGGLLTSPIHQINIGSGGVGQMIVSNGTVRYPIVEVSTSPGGVGTLTLAGGTNSIDILRVARNLGATGAVWITGGVLTNPATFLGENSAVGQMTISGGTMLGSNVVVGLDSGSQGTLAVAGGSLVVANAGNTGVINVNWGSITINGGTVTVDQLFVTNGAASVFGLTNGTLNTKSTTVSSAPFVVGNGTSAAVYNMVAGGSGFHNFNVGGLVVTNNATLTGCGTISGSVVVDPGGTVMAGCGAALYFDNGTVTNYGTIIATGGTVLNFYNPVVNAGTIDATGGNVQFFSTVTDNGTILTPTNSWTDGTGKWETGGNWSQGVAPTNTQAANLITNAGNKTVTIDATTSGSFTGTMTIRNLSIAGLGGSTNTLALSGAGLGVPLRVRSQFALSNNSAVVVNSSALQVDGVLSMGSPVGSGNQLVITNGGKVVSAATAIGGLPGFNNSVLVTGTNSVWVNTNTSLSVANSSGGIAIKIADGASLTATNVFLGNSATADGNVVIVTDVGSLWTNTGALFVGGATHHTQFIVSNGAAAFSSSATIGSPSGTTNSALVTGSNSLWRTDGAVRVGNGGIGDSLTVTDGGSVIASNASHTGLVTVDGATLVLGDGTFKADNLVVTNGGVVQYTQTYQVENANVTIASGNVQADSNFVVAGTVNSTATVAIAGGTLVATNRPVSLGNDGTFTGNGGRALMVVSNSGTLLASIIRVGNSSTNNQSDLIVAAGGTIRCPGGTNCLLEVNSLGTEVLESGTFDFDGSTAKYGITAPGDHYQGGGETDFGDLYVGYSDAGTVTVAGGLLHMSSRLIVGHFGSPPTVATGTVSMVGGQITVESYTIIGNSGVGQMTISDGLVTAADVIVGFSSNPGTLTLAGGTLTANGIVLPNPGSRFIFSGGWLNCKAITNANGQTATAGNGSTAAMVELLGGVSTFDKALTISAIATLSGVGTVSGGVINYGLIAPNGGALTFTGGVVTNYGTIVAPAGSSINFNGQVVNYGLIITNSAVHFNAGDPVNHGTLLDAASDSDGDGMNNADEALAGTNPLNSSSVLRILTIARESNDLRVTWSAVGGKRYVVQTSPGTSGSYSNNFTDLSPTISMPGLGGPSANYLDLGGAGNTPARYYRVRLVP